MIQADNLSRYFGSRCAVDGISFSVARGEVLGFIGPNGAGKSTAMRMLTGYIPPDSGTVRLAGFDLESEPLKARAALGYLPESAPLYPNMTLRFFLDFCASMRGLGRSRRRERIAEVAQLCFLEPVMNQTLDTLSKGYRHRACFAQAIIHDPDILILDEPTEGLDPNQKKHFRSLIRRMSRDKAVILSTHILDELESICDRVLLIDRGRLVFEGSCSQFMGKSPLAGTFILSIETSFPSGIDGILSSLDGIDRIEHLPSAEASVDYRIYLSGDASPGKIRDAVSLLCQEKGLLLKGFTEDRGSMDGAFHVLTGERDEEEGR